MTHIFSVLDNFVIWKQDEGPYVYFLHVYFLHFYVGFCRPPLSFLVEAKFREMGLTAHVHVYFLLKLFFLSILLTLFSSQIWPLHQQGCTQTQEVLQYKFELYPRSQLEGNTKALTRNKTTTKCIDQRTYTAANKKSQQTIPLNYFPHVPTLSKEVHNGSLQQFATIFHQDAFSLF